MSSFYNMMVVRNENHTREDAILIHFRPEEVVRVEAYPGNSVLSALVLRDGAKFFCWLRPTDLVEKLCGSLEEAVN